MENYDLVDIKSISKDIFEKINEELKHDISVSRFVCFNYSALVTNGIFYKDKLVGLLNLSYFIDNNIAVSIALLEKYRNLGIAKVVAEKIVDYYGKVFSNSKMFIFNCLNYNYNAIQAFKKMGLRETNEFDEIMMDEGADFFNNFYKENIYRKLEVK